MKILIIRFSSIGDIVLTTPIIRALKKQLPQAEIHFVTKKPFKSILLSNPYIHEIHEYDQNLISLIKKLQSQKFDFIVDLHHNLRSLLIKIALWNVPSGSFPKLNFQKWLMVNFKIDIMPNIHIVDRYYVAAKKLKIVPDQEGLEYYIPHHDEIEKEWLPASHQLGYIAVVIGANHNTKKLPLTRLIELCDRINKPIVLIGGKEDIALSNEVEKFFSRIENHESFEKKLVDLNKKALIFNACGKFNLNQSADLIKKSQAVFTHDTGMMHIAAAFHKPLYTIWGNTIPKFGMYPYKTRFTIFENNQLNCRPCSKIGHSQCPKGHFKCMNSLVLDFYLG